MAIKKGDFVELEYAGRIAESGLVFDTTDEKTAKESSIYNSAVIYGPVIVCIGQQHVLKGIERQLEGKGVGTYKFKISPEEGFGKKDAKLFQLVSTGKFRQQDITPVPGLQVNIDGIVGVVRTVTGGRTLVDFNHPLAGKELDYDVTVKRIVTDEREKVGAIARLAGVKGEAALLGSEATITTEKGVPERLKENVTEEVKKTIPALKNVVFKLKEHKAENTEQKTGNR